MVLTVTLLLPQWCLSIAAQAACLLAKFDATEQSVAWLSCLLQLSFRIHYCSVTALNFFRSSSLTPSCLTSLSPSPPPEFLWIHYTFLISCSCAATIYWKWVWKVVSWLGSCRETLRWYQILIFILAVLTHTNTQTYRKTHSAIQT